MNKHQRAATCVVFDEVADRLVELGCSGDPSEIHGLLCGQLAAGHRLKTAQWLKQVSELCGGRIVDAAAAEIFNRLYTVSLTHLEMADFAIHLLLPDEDDAIEQRVNALGTWCAGFLSGFGEGVKGIALSEGVKNVLRDFAEIAQVQSAIDQSDEAERDFMEVSEYVRMALITVFDEMNPPPSATVKSSRKLHRRSTPNDRQL